MSTRIIALLLLGLAACKTGKGPSITLRLAGPADPMSTTRCTAQAAQTGVTLVDVTSVRITLRARAADGTTTGWCDRVLPFPGAPPFLRVPDTNAAFIDIFAEAYSAAATTDPKTAGGVRRAASGSIYGADPQAASLAALRLFPSEGFRCAGGRLALARAFHTATLIPDGRVLFVGGLVAIADDPIAIASPREEVTATGSAEIFDPRDQSITPVTEMTPSTRAFHSAELIAGNGPCPAGNLAILLVGGLTVDAGKSILATSAGGSQGGRLVPFDRTTLSAPLSTHAASNEVLCLNPTTLAATRMATTGAAAAFCASSVGANGLVVADGIDYDPTMLNQPIPKNEIAIYPSAGAAPTTGATSVSRMGASLTQLDSGTGLLWGGGLLTDPTGELVSGLAATPTTSPIATLDAITQFHTATRLDMTGQSVLVTGGFAVTAGGVNTQPPSAVAAARVVNVAGTTVTVQPVTLGGGYLADTTCKVEGRYRPSGWESAIALPRQRVLITGGGPSTNEMDSAPGVAVRCADCEGGQTSLLCSTAQASIYAGNTLTPAAEPLQVARFGHASTTLLDGSILISGGIGSEPRAAIVTTVFIADLEVYSPRTLIPPYDSSVPMPIDLDDPIPAELSAAKLVRAPGAEATAPGSMTAAHECGSL